MSNETRTMEERPMRRADCLAGQMMCVVWGAFCVLALVSPGAFCAEPAEEPALPKFEFVYEKNDLPMPNEKGPNLRHNMGESSFEGLSFHHYDVYMRLADAPDPVFLSRGVGKVWWDGEPEIIYGISPEFVEIEWVVPGSLLHVSGVTCGVPGNGCFYGCLALLLHRKQGKWTVILRDSSGGGHNMGVGERWDRRLEFSHAPGKGDVIVREVKERFLSSGSRTRPILFWQIESSKKEGRDPFFWQPLTQTREWPCEAGKDGLVWGPGTRTIDLLEHEFEIEEVALWSLGEKVSRELWEKEDWKSNPAVQAKTQKVRALNPKFKTNMCSGLVVLEDDVAPYKPVTEVKYCGNGRW